MNSFKKQILLFTLPLLTILPLLLFLTTHTQAGDDPPRYHRLSHMGPDGDILYAGINPAITYNTVDEQFLVVWQADDDTDLLVDEEFEIYGQLIDARTGQEIGPDDFRISFMALDGNNLINADDPAVAYNPVDNEYLVVWSADNNIFPQVDGEFEIFVQRVAANGELIADPIKISDMGPDGDPIYDARNPEVVYNPTDHEYLVIWEGDDNSNDLIEGEFEIYGQRLTAPDAIELAPNDFRISDMGPDGFSLYDATSPAVVYNELANEYFVVWEGDDDIEGASEIYGQRLTATGIETDTNDFRITTVGFITDTTYDAINPSVAFNPLTNEYLVIWEGDNDTISTMVEGESEIWGQRLTANPLTEIGPNDFRITHMGPDGDPTFDAVSPEISYIPTYNHYVVLWDGEHNRTPYVEGEHDAFVQTLSATGDKLGRIGSRITDIGLAGSQLYDAADPAFHYDPIRRHFLLVWQGDDTNSDDEIEIYGQFFYETSTYIPAIWSP
ncbi:MAG TPA: hypothetical protein VLL52_21755 [Anaerolineae bacterium]|nr:hypothetical protein [Anaerolineae bacterium]